MNNNLDVFIKNLDNSSDQFLDPILENLMKIMEKEIFIEEADPKILFKTKLNQFKQKKEHLKRDLIEIFTDRKNRERIREGFELLLKDYPKISGGEEIKHELAQAAKQFSERILKISESKGEKEEEIPLVETYQQMYGLSDKSIENIYLYAHQRYQDSKGLKEAAILFYFLTEMNPYRFEPWLYLGICWIEQQSYLEALHALSMASIINPNHFLPHLYSAYCYLANHKIELAKAAFTLALSHASKEELDGFKEMIDSIKAQI